MIGSSVFLGLGVLSYILELNTISKFLYNVACLEYDTVVKMALQRLLDQLESVDLYKYYVHYKQPNPNKHAST